MSTRISTALLVSSPANIYYLTCPPTGGSGFGDPLSHERDAWMLVTTTQKYLFTDGRYESKELERQLLSRGIVLRIISHEKNLSALLLEICKKENISSIDFEANDLTVAEYEQFKSKGVFLKLANLGGSPLTNSGSLQISRAIKSDSELKLIKHACQLVDELLTRVIAQIKVGMSEQEILQFFYDPTIELAFPPIVAINENSAIPHYDTKAHGKKLANLRGSLILIDCGVRYKNYCSDITRMISVGKPNAEVMRAYDALYKAQQQAIANLEGSKTYKEVDQACRESLLKAGYPIYSHATGHGIGLQVHEAPHFSPFTLDTIKPGHVVTVEPGIYIPEKWGMRLEDTVVINKDGSVTTLTSTFRELIII